MSTTSASPLDSHESPVASTNKSRRGTASFVLGILAAVTWILPILGLILGIVAVVLGTSSRSDCQKAGRSTPWQATAGIVLGGLGILAAVAIFVVGIAGS